MRDVIAEFGYRMNSLSAETFFSDGVFLVEGTSEVLFYNALSKEIGIDLDRLNISILSVEGIGFKPYVAVCNALQIPWALRTDNDIFPKPTNAPTKHYFAGISRVMGILEDAKPDGFQALLDYWNQHKSENEWTYNTSTPQSAKDLNQYIRTHAKQYGLYIANIDLETDLASSELSETLKTHYNKRTVTSLVDAMQKHKATNMLDFLCEKQRSLSVLREDELAAPLDALANKVMERNHPQND